MPRIKLTNSTIDRLSIPLSGRCTYFDTELRGFGLRLGATGKTYIVQRDVNGTSRTLTIGQHGVFTPIQARKKAIELLNLLAQGRDPIAEKRRSQSQRTTLQTAFDSYLEVRTLSDNTAAAYKRVMQTSLRDWCHKPLLEITREMVSKRYATLRRTKGNAHANTTMRTLRAVMNFAAGQYEELNLVNPVMVLSQTRAWVKESRRTTIIKKPQLAKWYAGVMQLPSQIGRDYLRLVLFTGLRRREAARLLWKNVDFDDKTFTAIRTKNGQDLTLPMSSFIYTLLHDRYQIAELTADEDNPPLYVFPGPGANGHLEEPKKFLELVTESSGVEFTVHDLRRTFITIADSLDISAYAIKMLVNHSIGGNDVTGGYVIRNIERLRSPMQRITNAFMQAIGIQADAKVINFPVDVHA